MDAQRISLVDERLQPLVAEVLGIPAESVTNDLAMAAVESWDSLRHMELIGSIESTFGCELTFEEIVSMRTVREIRRVLLGKLGSD